MSDYRHGYKGKNVCRWCGDRMIKILIKCDEGGPSFPGWMCLHCEIQPKPETSWSCGGGLFKGQMV